MEILRYKETDSTNLRAKEAGNKGVSADTLFIADKQTAGVGRRGRSWESPEGENIYMSLLLKPDIEPSKAPMLTLVMAVAVAEGIRNVWLKMNEEFLTHGHKECVIVRDCGGEADINKIPNIQIKWPNDIIINKKKVCGILTEMALDGTVIKNVVIGVGINVNQKEFVSELKDKATSLLLENSVAQDREFDREAIISAVLEEFYKYYDGFLRAGDLSYLQERYNQMLVNRDAQVVIHEPGNEYKAHAIGINEQGELAVELSDGTRKNVYAGEVSVRGVYGYV